LYIYIYTYIYIYLVSQLNNLNLLSITDRYITNIQLFYLFIIFIYRIVIIYVCMYVLFHHVFISTDFVADPDPDPDPDTEK
jgi:hypothetical protein